MKYPLGIETVAETVQSKDHWKETKGALGGGGASASQVYGRGGEESGRVGTRGKEGGGGIW